MSDGADLQLLARPTARCCACFISRALPRRSYSLRMKFGLGAGAPGGIERACAYRAGSRISSDTRRKPANFSGNTGAIDFEANHGFMEYDRHFPTTQGDTSCSE